MCKILLFNPRSAVAKYRIPNSILNIAASVDGIYDWAIVDGNREDDPRHKIMSYFTDQSCKYFGVTVMPGPQLKQAIPVCKELKARFPHVTIIWGVYFASNQSKVVLESGLVD